MSKITSRKKQLIFGAVAMALSVSACSRSAEEYAADGRAALAKHDLKAAEIAYKNALDAAPDDPKLLLAAGQIALQLGDGDRAVNLFQQLGRHGDQARIASDYLAKALVMQGQPDKALEQLEKNPPATDVGHAARVAARFAKGDLDEGAADLDAALALAPDSVELGLLDAARANMSGDLERGTAIADRLLAKAPDNPDVLLLAGHMAMKRRRLAQAESYFNSVLKVRRGDATALVALGGIAADRGDAAKAKEYLKQAQQHKPGDPLSAYLLAQLAFDAGDIEGARTLLQNSPAGGADLPVVAMLEGLIAARRGSHGEAISDLQRYIRAGGDDMRARVALAGAYAATGEKAKALEAIRPVADAANASGNTLALAAQLAEANGDPVAARYRTRLAGKAKPDPIAGPMRQADAAIRRGDWQGADKIYAGLIAQGHGDNLILLNNAASVRLELGDMEQAIALARKAHQQAPTDPYVLDTLGWALFKAHGATPEAIGYMQAAARGAPNNNEIARHVAAVASAAS